MSLTSIVLGILFVAGDQGATLKEISEAIDKSEDTILCVLEKLTLTLKDDIESPIELLLTNKHYKLATKATIEPFIQKFAENSVYQPLTRAAIETLAIIAYRQPITRVGIEEIRGVASQQMIQRLIARNLVREVGRVEAPGRPYLYGVTSYFLDYFGLNDLNDLPEIEPLALNVELSSEALFKDKQWVLDVDDHLTENLNDEG